MAMKPETNICLRESLYNELLSVLINILSFILVMRARHVLENELSDYCPSRLGII